MKLIPKKSLGQNFLIIKIIKKLLIWRNKQMIVIIEIGPGTGNLTKKLLKKNQKNLLR